MERTGGQPRAGVLKPFVGALWQSWTVERLGNQQVLDEGLVDWRKLAQALHARYLSPDYLAAARFVSAVAQVAEAEDHHPDLRLTAGTIEVSLCTHEDGLWVTQKDVDMARTISEIAKELGLTPDPGAVTQLEIALDTAHEDSRPSGRYCSPVAPTTKSMTRSSIPPVGSPVCGSKAQTSTMLPANVGISTSGSLRRWPTTGSLRRWRPEGPSSTTPGRRRSLFSPIPTGTESACVRPRGAERRTGHDGAPLLNSALLQARNWKIAPQSSLLG